MRSIKEEYPDRMISIDRMSSPHPVQHATPDEIDSGLLDWSPSTPSQAVAQVWLRALTLSRAETARYAGYRPVESNLFDDPGV